MFGLGFSTRLKGMHRTVDVSPLFSNFQKIT